MPGMVLILEEGGMPMKTGRPRKPLSLPGAEREQLERWTSSRTLAHGLVRRAKIVLMSGDGAANTQIAQKLSVSMATVCKWRKRYWDEGLQGLYGEVRPGRPRSISDEKVMAVIRSTLKKKPAGATHWTVRSMAERTRLSKSTVHRIWKAFGLEPHRQRHFKLSTGPFFVEKVRDIVGLYLNPPDKAMVLCVDEKSQVQALDRTQPILPLGLGYVEGGHPRLCPSRHHHALCGPGCGHRPCDDPVQAPPPSPGVPAVPAPYRRQRTRRTRRPPGH